MSHAKKAAREIIDNYHRWAKESNSGAEWTDKIAECILRHMQPVFEQYQERGIRSEASRHRPGPRHDMGG